MKIAPIMPEKYRTEKHQFTPVLIEVSEEMLFIKTGSLSSFNRFHVLWMVFYSI